MKKSAFVTIIALLITSSSVYAVPELRLPFLGGEIWFCEQGNYNDPAQEIPGNKNTTHKKNSGMDYAWDFNWGSGSDDDLGKPLVASAAGSVVHAGWATGGWGYTVIIDYHDPVDESHGKTTHMLSNLEVKVGDYVLQGQVIGYCGGTGGWPIHAHYQTQNGPYPWSKSIPSTFVEVCENNGLPLEDHYYISTNYNYSPIPNHASVGEYPNGFHRDPIYCPSTFTPYSQPFIDLYVTKNDDGLWGKGLEIYGLPTSPVTQRIFNIYAQEFNHNGELYTMVLNPYVQNINRGYLGVCYPICGRIRAFWNPNRDGAPVTNEYYIYRGGVKYAVQWFEVSDNDYKLLAYGLDNNLFLSNAEYTLSVPRGVEFEQRLINDRERNDGIGGASEQPTPTPTLGSSQASNPWMDCQGSGVWGAVTNISDVGNWVKLGECG